MTGLEVTLGFYASFEYNGSSVADYMIVHNGIMNSVSTFHVQQFLHLVISRSA